VIIASPLFGEAAIFSTVFVRKTRQILHPVCWGMNIRWNLNFSSIFQILSRAL